MKVSRGKSLDRYYLLKLFGWGVFLHKIHHSDPPYLYHNHPWSGLSIVLRGKYIELRPDGASLVRWWNWLPAKRHHRVIILKPVWTLFIHGRRSNQWSVIDEAGRVTASEPWRGEKGVKDYARNSN